MYLERKTAPVDVSSVERALSAAINLLNKRCLKERSPRLRPPQQEQPPQASARRIALAELPVYRRDPKVRAPETGHPHPMDDSELSRVRNQFNQL
jgi:hypothetical protein